MFIQWIILLFGLALMIFGADWLVRGCILLARRIGMSEFLVSVFIIGIGTSAPELIISIISSANNQGSLVIGNAVASNIINILGILGIGALIYPITTDGREHKTDIAFLFLTTIAMMWTVSNGVISRFDGVILLLIAVAYFFFLKRTKEAKKHIPVKIHIAKIFIPLFFGSLALYFGSEYFMDALNKIISVYNIDETIAGILIVAPGTCTPELLVTMMAAIKKRPGIALGNILGSCLSNILLVISSSALIAPLVVSPHILSLDIWAFVIVTTILCWQLLKFKKLSITTGLFYLFLLVGYIILVCIK